MPEGVFLFELARAESAAVPERVVVAWSLFGPKATLACPDPTQPLIHCGIGASAFEIATRLREACSVPVGDEAPAGERGCVAAR